MHIRASKGIAELKCHSYYLLYPFVSSDYLSSSMKLLHFCLEGFPYLCIVRAYLHVGKTILDCQMYSGGKERNQFTGKIFQIDILEAMMLQITCLHSHNSLTAQASLIFHDIKIYTLRISIKGYFYHNILIKHLKAIHIVQN